MKCALRVAVAVALLSTACQEDSNTECPQNSKDAAASADSSYYSDPLDVPLVRAGSVGKCVPFKISSSTSICLLDESQYGKKQAGSTGTTSSNKQTNQGIVKQVDKFLKVTSRDLLAEAQAKCSKFPVRNQDGLGWCTAHATLSAMEMKMCLDRGAMEMMSVPYLWHLGQLGGGIAKEPCKKGGWLIQNAVKVASDSAAIPLKLWPYSSWAKDCPTNAAEILKNKPSNLSSVVKTSAKYIIQDSVNISPRHGDSVKTAIAAGYPVVYVFPIIRKSGWYEGDKSYNVIDISGEPQQCYCSGASKSNVCSSDKNCVEGWHTIVIVGFNDSTKRFKILNSWGPNMGDKGTYYVTYNYVNKVGGGGVAVKQVNCNSECSPAGSAKCASGILSTCSNGNDGCSKWVEVNKCKDGCADSISCKSSTHDAGVKDAGQPDTSAPDANKPDIPIPDIQVPDAPVPDQPQSVAVPLVTSPYMCQVLASPTSAELQFHVSSLTGIKEFKFDVKEVTGCQKNPTGGSITGYPTKGTASSSKKYTLSLLLPGKWYKYSIEAIANSGYISSNTVGWFSTALKPDLGLPDAPIMDGPPLPQPPSIQTLASGANHNCRIATSGLAKCWGRNDYGQSKAPWGIFKQISGGYNHTCGITSTDKVVCWGDNSKMQSSPPTDSFLQVSAGLRFSCGVTSLGTVKCWGDNYDGKATPPTGLFKKVSAGSYHACGLQKSGTIVCWGSNTYSASTPPTGTYIDISSGSNHTCALTPKGTIKCWGDSNNGKTTPPVGNFLFGQVSAGLNHTCGLTTTGKAVCWGDNTYKQGTAPSNDFSQIRVGDNHSCGITVAKGTEECWGDNGYGESMAPTMTHSKVSAGSGHTCSITDKGQLKCWGDNSYGESIPPSGSFKQVSAGIANACAITAIGDIKCWGDNNDQQSTPPIGKFSQVSTGGYHHSHNYGTDRNYRTCGISSNGSIKCWGDSYNGGSPPTGAYKSIGVAMGSYGMCAVSTTNSVKCWGAYSPLPTKSLSNFSLGGGHGCGVSNAGLIECWGSNSKGQSTAPGGQFIKVSAGFGHSCGITKANSITCWGSIATYKPPVGKFSEISNGWSHACAVSQAGDVECWGNPATFHPAGP